MLAQDRVRDIEAYVYARYVKGESTEDLNESEACRFLDRYYSQAANFDDPNCCYAGILWFEVSYQDGEDQTECLEKARYWLEHAESISSTPWEPISERLTDIREILQ